MSYDVFQHILPNLRQIVSVKRDRMRSHVAEPAELLEVLGFRGSRGNNLFATGYVWSDVKPPAVCVGPLRSAWGWRVGMILNSAPTKLFAEHNENRDNFRGNQVLRFLRFNIRYTAVVARRNTAKPGTVYCMPSTRKVLIAMAARIISAMI
jgi:hypothetical protein